MGRDGVGLEQVREEWDGMGWDRSDQVVCKTYEGVWWKEEYEGMRRNSWEVRCW